MRSIRHLPFVVLPLGLLACSALLGDYSVGGNDAVTPGTEGGGQEGGAGTETGVPGDSGGDANVSTTDAADANNVVYTYNDVTKQLNWQSSPLATVFGGITNAFAGGAFDGRYVYAVPTNTSTGASSIVQRFDTQGTWANGAGWSAFNMATAPGGTNAKGYYGAVFDGRYMYFTPFHTGSATHGLVARYDTKGLFTDTKSWTFLDISSFGSGFGGGVFDGRYVYFLPTLLSGKIVARYDTKGAFALASFEAFSTTSIDQTAFTYDGGTFDGKYIYLAPYKSIAPCSVVRFEVSKPFAQPASWQSFDVSAFGCGFRGATTDGKHVYFAGDYENGAFSGKVLRYDTARAFQAAGGYSVIDLKVNVNASLNGFAGIVFDGRRIYTVPQGSNVSLVGVYDTTLPFALPSSWKTFDIATVTNTASQFTGGVFDGRYTYFIPSASGVALRFDAKSPTGFPPFFGASFY
jgi:hypothetical protein